MKQEGPPWNHTLPVSPAAEGGQNRRSANHWKRWDAKPEANAGASRNARSVALANRWKRRDAKPEAKAAFGRYARSVTGQLCVRV